MSVSVSSGHQTDWSLWLSSENVPHPSKRRKRFREEKLFCREWEGGELKLIKWLLDKTINKQSQRKKKPKFSKNAAKHMNLQLQTSLIKMQLSALAEKDASCLNPPGRATRSHESHIWCAMHCSVPRGWITGCRPHHTPKSNLESGLWFRLALSFTFKVQPVIM